MEAVAGVVVGGRVTDRPVQLPRRATDRERLIDEHAPCAIVIRGVGVERVQTVAVVYSSFAVPAGLGGSHADEVVAVEVDAVVAIAIVEFSGHGAGDKSVLRV